MGPRPEEPLFFKIGDAAARVGVESHVLRFWTKEFPQIQPCRVGGRHRLYRADDITIFLEIKRLLYDERFTIEGARKKLTEDSTKTLFDVIPKQDSKSPNTQLWNEFRQELLSIRHLLVTMRSTAQGSASDG